jgi:hypothetical protein
MHGCVDILAGGDDVFPADVAFALDFTDEARVEVDFALILEADGFPEAFAGPFLPVAGVAFAGGGERALGRRAGADEVECGDGVPLAISAKQAGAF